MLYLDRISIHNFKSFKHANINFNKGFSCVVGPNGSGKSAIFDAILFSLGEGSLKRLRASSAKDLINRNAKAKKEDGVKRAYSHVTFTGDETIDIARIIKSNNKIGYRINGKRATKQDVLDILKANNAGINETNTIMQGEIEKYLHLTPKERRELIDIAAGIREFDDKKEASMKELEKVETKITEANIMLNERQGFLKELEKEKIDAEKYIELTNRLKSITYTILKARESQITKEYDKAVVDYEKLTNRRKEIENEIQKLEDEISNASSYREKVSKKVNEGSIELGTANKKLEEINSNIKIKESQMLGFEESVQKSRERTGALKSEFNSIKEQNAANDSSIKALNEELENARKELGSLDIGEGLEGKAIVGQYSEAQKNVEMLEEKLLGLNGEYIGIATELSRLESSINEINEKLSNNEAQKASIKKEIEKIKQEIESKRENAAESRRLLSTQQSDITGYRKRISEIDSDKISIREALALSGRNNDRISSALKAKVKGVYGKASDLCSYDEKYAIAVNAAAASRLNYLIVDNIETANEAIQVLKKDGLGRASFIPIKDVVVNESSSKTGLTPLLDAVSFDAKYKKAFDYIFSNTFIIDNVSNARKSGLGKHRFVTLDGELVEQSGIVTGGTLTQQQLPKVLEAKLGKLEQERESIFGKIKEAEAAEEKTRRQIADMEISCANLEAGAKHMQFDIDKIQENSKELVNAQPINEQRIMSLKKSRDQFAKKKIEAEKAIENAKEESNRLYNALNMIVGSEKGSKEAKGNSTKIKSLREKAESTKISIASLERENQVREERTRAISKELKEIDSEIKATKAKTQEAEKAILEFGKKRQEIQENIRSNSQSSESLIKELQDSQEKLEKLSMQKGRCLSDINKMEKEQIETESKRSQLQTRLSDIKAELLSYQETEQVQFKEIEELEKSQIEYTHEKELLGNVNLKAPEAYSQRKRDVDEAMERLSILGVEKDSILSMINEIESKKLNIFNETFDDVNENFKSLYSHIFDGTAYLSLDNPSEPFNSKLMFIIQGQNKKQTPPEELSGGQKSLLMLALIFSIQMRNPMSFYIFDEIDASLDKENSKKLSKLIKELSKRSQFIVVSHNDSLIASADTAIGVTKQNGQSQVVGIQIATKNGPNSGVVEER